MESQSGESLPIIYRPFDGAKRPHWRDRGAAFDFLSVCGAGRLLDFGPGDGWPSLIVAPYAEEVIGADASRKRVEVCTANAARLGIKNASFTCVGVAETLPFANEYFDGVMAASAVEQTPEPEQTLRELHRVLKPGGRLRICYEALNRYRGQRERELEVWPLGRSCCRLLLTFRDCDRGHAVYYGLTLSLTAEEAGKQLGVDRGVSFEEATIDFLPKNRPLIVDARRCRLKHPSGRTYLTLLQKIGFGEIHPTHSGCGFAGRLYDRLPAARRPGKLSEVDELLQPLVAVVVELAAPIENDPWITAAK